MKNAKKKLILLVIAIILLLSAVFMTIFINKKIGKIASVEENEKKAVNEITGVSDNRFIYTVNYDNTTINLIEYIGSDIKVIIPSTIDGYTVTGIAVNSLKSFFRNENVTEITIPETVTEVSALRLNETGKLAKIEVAEGNGKFKSIDGVLYSGPEGYLELVCVPTYKDMPSWRFPEGVIEIGRYAFSYVAMGYDLTGNRLIPDTVSTISDGAFYKSSGLLEITIPSTVHMLGRDIFKSSGLIIVTLEEGIETLTNSMFEDCENLRRVNLPNSLKKIEALAFNGCGLIKLEIPDGVEIGARAFANCPDLTITIPNSVNSIHDTAFGTSTNGDVLGTIVACNSDSYAYNYAVNKNMDFILLDIERISIKTNPTKKTYIQKLEQLDLTGGILTLEAGNITKEISMKSKTITTSGFNNTNLGPIEVTVNYGGKSTTFNVEIVEKSLSEISIKTNPTKMTYIQGVENLDLTGGELTLKYNDNSLAAISMKLSGVTATGFSNSTVGRVPVTISYGGKSTTLNVEVVAKTLTEISIKTNPTKMTYIQGVENLDLTGGELTLKYNDNSTETKSMKASGVKATGFSNSTVGRVPVTISYGGKSTTLNVEVVAKTLTGISIKTNPTKMTYKQNTENLDLTGGELTLTYNDNSTETKSMKASGVTATGFSNSTLGTVPVTISYGGKSTTLNVTIIENQQPQKTLSEISVKTLPTKTSYKKDNEDLDLTGGIITLKYTDNTTEEKAMTSNDVTVTGFSNTTLGKKELTVKYGNKTTKFEVEIIGNFNYEQTPDGDGVIITGGEDGNPNIVIPPEIDGKPVTGIGDGAFKDRDDLESVEIPDSVIDIADNAFEGSEDTIIICNPGSKAEEFAKDHDMSYIYKDKTIAGLSVKTLPSKITYTQGVDTKLDLTGGRLTVSYSEAGLTSVLRMTSKGITVSNVDMTTVGTKLVTVGYSGKSAEPFEITVGGTQSVLLGDIDGNGVVESTDLLLMKRHIIAGSKTEWILTGDKFTRGDMNSDNVINPTDLLLLKRKIVSRVDR